MRVDAGFLSIFRMQPYFPSSFHSRFYCLCLPVWLVTLNRHSSWGGFQMIILGSMSSLILAAWLLWQVSLTSRGGDVMRHGATLIYVLTGISLVGALITVISVHEIPRYALPCSVYSIPVGIMALRKSIQISHMRQSSSP